MKKTYIIPQMGVEATNPANIICTSTVTVSFGEGSTDNMYVKEEEIDIVEW